MFDYNFTINVNFYNRIFRFIQIIIEYNNTTEHKSNHLL